MPAIAAIALDDYNGGGTPVTHTFTPVTTDGSKGLWANRAGGVPVGFERLDITVREAKSSTGAHVVEANLLIPETATVDGKVVKVRETKAYIRFNFPQDGASAERIDVLTLVGNLIANAAFGTMVENIEPAY